MIKTLVERFEAVLSELDALAGAGGLPEALEDLNAEFEDAIMMLSEIDPREEDWREELSEALDGMKTLAGDYRTLAGDIPGVGELADRIETTCDAP